MALVNSQTQLKKQRTWRYSGAVDFMNLNKRIENRSANVVVVGGGYVGHPLAVAVAQAGFKTTIYDTSAAKVDAITQVGGRATTDAGVLEDADVVVICVPTPLNKTRDPDNSYILAVADALNMVAYRRMVSRTAHQQLVILESTTFPGFTREVLLPKLSATMKLDETLFLAFSPERIDPGNAVFNVSNTPKIVGGVSEHSAELAETFYAAFVDKVYRVASTDAAEMAKLLENTYRAVNIALVNEIAIMCGHLGLDTREVIAAAATKPFGFQAFQPGPGVGGHCIGLDPLYLSWKLKTLKYNARFIELADRINSTMPEHVVSMVADALNNRSKAVRGAHILIYGVAYKRDVDDVRESPALDIIEQLLALGAIVSYYDAHVPTLKIGDRAVSRETDFPEGYDCAVVVTDHTGIDYERLPKLFNDVIDTRGVVPRGANVVSL